jgi:hypothetical protein
MWRRGADEPVPKNWKAAVKRSPYRSCWPARARPVAAAWPCMKPYKGTSRRTHDRSSTTGKNKRVQEYPRSLDPCRSRSTTGFRGGGSAKTPHVGSFIANLHRSTNARRPSEPSSSHRAQDPLGRSRSRSGAWIRRVVDGPSIATDQALLQILLPSSRCHDRTLSATAAAAAAVLCMLSTRAAAVAEGHQARFIGHLNAYTAVVVASRETEREAFCLQPEINTARSED